MYELDGGAQTLQNMLSAIPGQVQLAQTVMPRLRDPHHVVLLNEGEVRLILGHVKGREPFSDTNVQRYLAEYAYKEPKREEEDYANHS